MTAFSPTDAAFEGFRLSREQPKALLVWTGVSLLSSVVSAIYLINIGPEARDFLEAGAKSESADPAQMFAFLQAMAPMSLLGLLVQCVMACAVYRIMLRPEDKGFGYLKLGMDELRLIALTLIYVVLAMGLIVVASLAAGIATVAAAALGQGAAMFVGLVMYVFILGLLLFVAVRMSLAPVLTFARQKIDVFGSWKLTHSQFWRLVGAYSLAVSCIIVVALLVLVIFTAVAALITGGSVEAAQAVFNPDHTSLATYFAPLTVLYLLLASGMTALYYVVICAPAAVAFQALSKGEPPPAAAP